MNFVADRNSSKIEIYTQDTNAAHLERKLLVRHLDVKARHLSRLQRCHQLHYSEKKDEHEE